MKNALNKLVLGTAQLGLDYGINNIKGKPTEKKTIEILSFAYKNGIKIFDTAHLYGNVEEILGEFVKNKRGVKIITKCNRFGDLQESLRSLNKKFVDGLLLHNPAQIKNIDFLIEIKRQGLTKNIGVSVYNPEDAMYAVRLKAIDYIQVPYNIFDQRLDKTNFFQLARKNKKKVFARSIFLQGLLLMKDEKIPAHLKNVKNYLSQLDKIIGKYNFSRKQAALLFSLGNKNIDYIVFGADNIEQIREVVSITKKGFNFKKCEQELKVKFRNVEKYIISPNLWKKQKIKKSG